MKKSKKKTHEKYVLYGFLVFALVIIAIAIFSTYRLLSSQNKQVDNSPKKPSLIKMTPYDRELAIKFMDKNNDGKCDVCGMPVDMCISSGQLQCNMDSRSTIGILGSQHIHADWKVYINGEQIDFSDKSHMDRMKKESSVSNFIHVDSGNPLPEKNGDVLHMHATGVPLWIFFDSINMDLSKDCLVLDNGKKFCNDDKNTLKFYVNGKPDDQYENYVFKGLDKILISYGNETDLTQQLNSITDFTKNH
ncbi:MAG: hypothetical protein J4428_01090 [Candidatus Aenigmarchaeota archaeon]|nr:hypothetical protein [Candidatus Aenigmarchaeota archaeon]